MSSTVFALQSIGLLRPVTPCEGNESRPGEENLVSSFP